MATAINSYQLRIWVQEGDLEQCSTLLYWDRLKIVDRSCGWVWISFDQPGFLMPFKWLCENAGIRVNDNFLL